MSDLPVQLAHTQLSGTALSEMSDLKMLFEMEALPSMSTQATGEVLITQLV